MTLEEFAENTIREWYAMGEKDFPKCIEIAEDLGLWNFAAELRLMEKYNQQNEADKSYELRQLFYHTANPFKK